MSEEPLGLVVVAAGASSRMRGIDKVWEPLSGCPMVWYSLARLAPHAQQSVLVVREADVERANNAFLRAFPQLSVVPGGRERQESVMNGLAALEGVEVVAVHDAARPLAPARLLRDGAALLVSSHAAIPAHRLHDTIKQVREDGTVAATLDRSTLWAVQTPQVFRFQQLWAAHALAEENGFVGTDDAGLLERVGYEVKIFPGPPWNIKVTTPDDLAMARFLLAQHVTE